ncbi:MAG TPA: UrcA family protein [Steroidobacteraceae bacterium]|nr:UrcA family protein [Steroidobacteraceae bacterium]
MKSVKFLIPVAALALSSVAAAGSRDASSVVVRYGDLNLESRAGVAGLHKRLSNAAQSVCGNLNSRILGLNDAYDRCVQEALANSVSAVGNSNLTNFHASKGRGTVVASN